MRKLLNIKTLNTVNKQVWGLIPWQLMIFKEPFKEGIISVCPTRMNTNEVVVQRLITLAEQY